MSADELIMSLEAENERLRARVATLDALLGAARGCVEVCRLNARGFDSIEGRLTTLLDRIDDVSPAPFKPSFDAERSK